MADRLDIAQLLSQIATLRRGAENARRAALRSPDPVAKDAQQRQAEGLDRQADEIEVRLAILKAALRASERGHEVAAFRPLFDWRAQV